MSDPVEQIARAVLYEGYLLYPYTRSAPKNQVRWTFGVVHPPAWPESSEMRTECLLRPGPRCRLEVLVRCLQLAVRLAPGEIPWQEAAERTVVSVRLSVASLVRRARRLTFDLPGGEDGERRWERVLGSVEVAAEPVEAGAIRLAVQIRNSTPLPAGADRDAALLRSLVSTHTVLRVEGGELCSLADPPDDLLEAARACVNQGTWPVLVGEPGAKDTVLSSPIILEDYPRVAPESPGDLFDATEIDELLTLRILTLTDEEKAQMREADERARELLERTESLDADQLLRLHGTLRGLRVIREEGP